MNSDLTTLRRCLFLALLAAFTGVCELQAQQGGEADETVDESSRQAEESEDAYRRRMELEDARDRERFSNTTFSQQAEQEKIDKLPPESQENIRDQMTEIIMENGQWEPRDALEEYPYEPTEAAQQDPELRRQEEDAWAEQVEKYHQREAAAFGASRGSMQGGQQQARAGNGQQGGEDGSGQAGSEGAEGDQAAGGASAGTYEPYESSRDKDSDAVSTAGVSESALDFLRRKQGQSTAAGGESVAESGESPQELPPDGSLPISELDQLQGMAAQSGQETADEEAANEVVLVSPGTIAIEDLDKLEGVEQAEKPEEEPD